MKLFEITGDILDTMWFSCVQGQFIKGWRRIWVFDSREDANDAGSSQAAYTNILSKSLGDYLVPVSSENGIDLLIQMTPDGYHASRKDKIIAVMPTRESCVNVTKKITGRNEAWPFDFYDFPLEDNDLLKDEE
jgi:hypothetical protein